MGCENVRKKIEAEIWNHDPDDGTIYRVVQVPGEDPKEEFIYCTDPAAKDFLAMHKDDAQKWLDLLTEKCACQSE